MLCNVRDNVKNILKHLIDYYNKLPYIPLGKNYRLMANITAITLAFCLSLHTNLRPLLKNPIICYSSNLFILIRQLNRIMLKLENPINEGFDKDRLLYLIAGLYSNRHLFKGIQSPYSLISDKSQSLLAYNLLLSLKTFFYFILHHQDRLSAELF